MGYSASDTAQKHERILKESIRLFREKGFSGVSVSEVMKAAGLTHGPFYNHFASKEALLAETLRHEKEAALQRMRELPSTTEGLVTLIDFYLSEAHRDDCEDGCSVAALASEARQQEAEVQTAFTERISAFIDLTESHFPWSSPELARTEAIHALSAMIGGLILSRAVNDAALSDEILAKTRAHLASQLPQ